MTQEPSARALQEAREWLARAERDLQAAQNELQASPPLPEISAYHAQQAAEKALKAFLTAHSVPFRFTHDLVELQAQCQGLDPRFARFLTAAQTLNPYATQFRYPGGPLAPPESETAQALELANGIVRFVQQELSRFV
jgi:HEPN domain-containing protein